MPNSSTVECEYNETFLKYSEIEWFPNIMPSIIYKSIPYTVCQQYKVLSTIVNYLLTLKCVLFYSE